MTSTGRVPRVRVEFYGLARLRAGRSDLHIPAQTVGAALSAADTACPDLRIFADDRVAGHYLVSLNGDRFTLDPQIGLKDGDAILVFGADAGG